MTPPFDFTPFFPYVEQPNFGIYLTLFTQGMKRFTQTIISGTLWIVLAVSCITLSCNRSEAPRVALTVSAAISLKESLEEIRGMFIRQHQDIGITYNFAGSGTLLQQIKHGAPIDVFISAADRYIDELEKNNLLLPDTRHVLLKNTIVLIVPKGDSTVKGFDDLYGSSVRHIAIGEPKSVPAGMYAEEIFTKLEMIEAIQLKLVYAKDVRQVLTYVEEGNADAGIVYFSDALSSTKVKIAVETDERLHAPPTYPAAIIRSTSHPEEAKEFLSFLRSKDAGAIFERHGFIVPEK
jgi:molybdate transport system substrate-binding protein